MDWLVAIITGVVLGIIIYGMRPASENRANFSLFILLGVAGAVVAEWFFAHVLGIRFGGIGPASFRWDAIVWGVIGSAIPLAIYEAVLLQPEQRIEEEEVRYTEPSISRPTAHEYKRSSTKKRRESGIDKTRDDDNS